MSAVERFYCTRTYLELILGHSISKRKKSYLWSLTFRLRVWKARYRAFGNQSRHIGNRKYGGLSSAFAVLTWYYGISLKCEKKSALRVSTITKTIENPNGNANLNAKSNANAEVNTYTNANLKKCKCICES